MTILSPPGDNGEARRDVALALLAARRLFRNLQRAAVRLALERGSVTADDIRDAVVIPPGIRPAVVGAVVRTLVVAGLVRHIDLRPSRRPVAHARPVRVWELVDPAAARPWLAANPALPLPAEGGAA